MTLLEPEVLSRALLVAFLEHLRKTQQYKHLDLASKKTLGREISREKPAYHYINDSAAPLSCRLRHRHATSVRRFVTTTSSHAPLTIYQRVSLPQRELDAYQNPAAQRTCNGPVAAIRNPPSSPLHRHHNDGPHPPSITFGHPKVDATHSHNGAAVPQTPVQTMVHRSHHVRQRKQQQRRRSDAATQRRRLRCFATWSRGRPSAVADVVTTSTRGCSLTQPVRLCGDAAFLCLLDASWS